MFVPHLFLHLLLSLTTVKCQSGFFWQLTDMHVDTGYDPVHGDPSKACHPSSSATFNLSDYGDFRCDAPMDLIERTIRGMRDIKSDPDFIIWNGDSITHIGITGRPPPMSYVTNIERRIVSSLRSNFPNTKILPVLGNHDSSPPDFFPDSKETKTNFYREYFQQSNWSSLITSPLEQKQFLQCGYYKSLTLEKTFIILNTNLYYQNNNTGVDPCGQFKWLKAQLKRAKRNSVILAAHVPPGYYERNAYGPFMMTKEGDYHYNEFFIDIVTKFAGKIYAQFYGHTHTDSFRLFGYPNVTSVAFIAPSVTPKVDWVSGTFPSIRLYEHNKTNLINFEQYYFNITEKKPSWKMAYDFGANYGVKDLSVKSLKGVFEDISKDSKTFARYYELNTVYHKESPCELKCIHTHLCGLSQLRVKEMKKCLSSGQDMFQILHSTTEYNQDTFVSLFKMQLNPFAEIAIYVVIIAPLCGFLVSFAYLIRSRRLHVGRGYRSVPLMEEI